MKPTKMIRYLMVSYVPKKLSPGKQISYFKLLGIIGYLFRKRERIIQVEVFDFQDSKNLWKVNCTDGIIYIPTLSRISRFIWGIDHALNRLAAQYDSTGEDIDKSTFVVDGGANIGEYSLWAMKKDAAGAIVIEPDRKNLACALLNLQEFKGKVEFLETALSEKNGISKFYFSSDFVNSSMYSNESIKKNTEIKKVKTVTLDHVYSAHLKERKFIFKLDAEGHEPEVIRGGRQFFKHARMFSVDVSAERNQTTTQIEVENLLDEFGLPYKVRSTQNSRIVIRKSV